jgi:D-cysteine desulfhydrase
VISTTGCPLFSRFPALETTVPRVDLCLGPSPVRTLDSLARHLGTSDLWIKNDGLLGAAYGGNKVRKLEFVLAHARQRNASRIITFGGTGSHHCLATAIYAQPLGFDVTVVLMEQPVTDEVERNLSALRRYGVRIVRAGSLPTTVLKSVVAFGRAVKAGVPPRLPYVIWVGASSARGCLGYVNAALELRDQIESGDLPEPSSIVVPLGSNGTPAGLLVGLRLAGLGAEVVPVQVSDMPGIGSRGVARLADRTLAFLRRAGADVPDTRFRISDLTTIVDPETIRYGHPTQSCREAKRIMSETEGVDLDLTYTAKTVAQLMERDELPRPVLYWHTLNAHPLAEIA